MRSLVLVILSSLLIGTAAPAYSNPVGNLKAGIAAANRGEWADAIRLLSLAIDSGQLKPNALVPAHGNRGAAYFMLDQNELALADMTRSIELIPGSGYDNQYAAYSNRASLHFSMENFTAALRDSEQALRLNVNDHVGLYNRARAREKLGQREAAVQDYRMVLKLSPDHKNARAALSRLGEQ